MAGSFPPLPIMRKVRTWHFYREKTTSTALFLPSSTRVGLRLPTRRECIVRVAQYIFFRHATHALPHPNQPSHRLTVSTSVGYRISISESSWNTIPTIKKIIDTYDSDIRYIEAFVQCKHTHTDEGQNTFDRYDISQPRYFYTINNIYINMSKHSIRHPTLRISVTAARFPYIHTTVGNIRTFGIRYELKSRRYG